jgi:ABC-type dipeptide/oligopeptide/nickel transport system permease subunit/ABC-type transport system substrate-binding protein
MSEPARVLRSLRGLALAALGGLDPRARARFLAHRGARVGAALVVFVALVAIVGPFVAPHDPAALLPQGLLEDGTPAPPGELWLGADTMGRDELSRLLHGGTLSLGVALVATAIAVALGLCIGVVSGSRRGPIDSVAMQTADVLSSLPFLLVAITIERAIGEPSPWSLAILLGCLSWTTLARVTRTKTQQIRELDYVQAARALGFSEARILFRHVLPNVLGPAIVLGTTLVAQMILVESAMSFLGVGVQPPASTWGTMLHDGQDVLSVAPRLVLFPGALIVMTVFGFNLLGEGLRDAVDARSTGALVAGSSASKRRRSRDDVMGLAGLGVLIGGLALFVAFVPPVPQHPSFVGAGNDTPRRGGTLVVHHEDDMRSLDPAVAYDEISGMGLKLVFETLLDYDEALSFVPRLAREMPEIADGGRTYTFHLRDGVHFHPSPHLAPDRTLVAEDVRYEIERVLAPATGSPGAPYFRNLLGADEYEAGRAEHVRGIEVLDALTIRFRLSVADQTFLNAMALSFAAPVPREVVEAPGSDFAHHPIGTGAFAFESWEPALRATFVRHDGFFLEGQPYLDRIVLDLDLSRGPAFLRLQAGEIDHMHRFTPSDNYFLHRAPAWQPYQTDSANLDIWGVGMNCELAPFDDVHVRRAVAFAIDGEHWRRARGNRLRLVGQPLPANMPGYVPGLAGEHHLDLERAREEMRLAGHPVEREGERWIARGLEAPIEVWVGAGETGQAYGELIQHDLAQIGLDIRIRQVAFPVYLAETARRRTVPLFLTGWSADFPDPSNFFDTLFHSRSISETGSQNRAFYQRPELDALLDRARVEPDRTQRMAMYAEASRMIVDDAPWAFVFSNTVTDVWQPYVRGYRVHPVWRPFYRDVWLDLPRRRASAEDFAGEDASVSWLGAGMFGEPSSEASR